MLTAAAQAESEGDTWLYAEEVYTEGFDYEAASYAYRQAGLYQAYADQLRAAARAPRSQRWTDLARGRLHWAPCLVTP
jgi:hypothetical protein